MADIVEVITRLREKISDTRYVVPVFDVQMIDKDATKATVEYDGTNFILDATGGKAVDASFLVTNSSYDTIAKLSHAIAKTTGWDSRIDSSAETDHPSKDLQITTPLDAKKERVQFRSRRFSDSELSTIITGAIYRHNQEMTVETIPLSELPLALCLAHCECLYRMATDTVKRSGLDQDAKTLIEIARQIEKKYLDDVQRLNLADNPTSIDDTGENEATEASMSGDMTVGKAYRVNPRTGKINAAFNFPPPIAKGVSIRYVSRADGNFVELSWHRLHVHDFDRVIIVKHTSPDFSLLLRQYMDGRIIDPPEAVEVFNSFDQRITVARDYDIVPGTFYYKIFVMDTNSEFSKTEPLQVVIPAN